VNSAGRKWLPTLIVLAIFLFPILFIHPKTYITLTISGLAMGMLLFLVSSGFSLIFGFLSVLNLAHGALFTWGAYIGFTSFTLINKWTGWGGPDSVFSNIVIFLLPLIIAGLLVSLLGIITERLVIRPVYGSHLFQIFITVGAMIVMEELVRIIWGPNDEVMPVPMNFMGSWDLFDVVVSKYPLIAIVIGLILYFTIYTILRKTKLGTIVRAGVENPEMVRMSHYRYFAGVLGGVRPGRHRRGDVGHLRQIDSPGHGRRSHRLRIDRGHHRRSWKHDRFCGGGPDGRPFL
jgi:branched-chain amino acid transport system permease protein